MSRFLNSSVKNQMPKSNGVLLLEDADDRPPLQRVDASLGRSALVPWLRSASCARRASRLLDPGAEIYLFGSRIDDSRRGGDIDLLVVSDKLGFRDVLRLRTAILEQIGWQQLDLIVRGRNQLNEPLAATALETGIKL